MVLGVCQRVLGDPHMAQDAFQAVFLVLARKAETLVHHPNLTGWLHQTALRTALKLRTRQAIRGQRERQLAEESMANLPAPTPSSDTGEEIRGILDEELNRLPDRYRLPLVLAYFEQQSYEQIGLALGLPFDTVKNRLARGRDRLRKRLVRRRAAVSEAALGALLAKQESFACLPALTQATVATARDFASGTAMASAAVSANTLLLAEEMTRAVATGTALTTTITTIGATIVKTKLVTVAAIAILAIVTSIYLTQHNRLSEPSTPPSPHAVAASSSTAHTLPAPSIPLPPPSQASATKPPPTGPTAGPLILRQLNPPMSVTDARGQRYQARKIADFARTVSVWRHYAGGMDPYFSGIFRLTQEEQAQLQQLLDTIWLDADGYANCFNVTKTGDELTVQWKGDAYRDLYKSQCDAISNQVMNGVRQILGADRAEVLGWIPNTGTINWPHVLPGLDKPFDDYRLTVSVTNVNGVIAMRYKARFTEGSVSGQNPGLGPWPALGEQLGVSRQTVMSYLAAQRQKAIASPLVRYRDPSVPFDDAPIAAEDTATGDRYVYAPVSR
jgi:RNA polymerase sigma factor (sigma-70 family)